MRSPALYSLAALAGAAMLAVSLSPAAAFTLSGPSLQQPVVSAQIDKVWWRHHHRHCWRNHWGHLRCSW
jgi:hypothetical protein